MTNASKNAMTFAHVGVMVVKLTILTNTKKCTNAAIAPTAINHRACLDVDVVTGVLFIGLFTNTSGRSVRVIISVPLATQWANIGLAAANNSLIN